MQFSLVKLVKIVVVGDAVLLFVIAFATGVGLEHLLLSGDRRVSNNTSRYGEDLGLEGGSPWLDSCLCLDRQAKLIENRHTFAVAGAVVAISMQ